MTSTAAARPLESEADRPSLALLREPDRDPAGTGRDPEFIERNRGLLETWASYFNPEVRGLDQLPKRGPFLVVGNHSGGGMPPDMPVLMTSWWRQRGAEEPVYGLFHSAFFGLPGVGDAMKKAGGMEANPEAAETALRAGGSVLVYRAATTRCSVPGPSATRSISTGARASSGWPCAPASPSCRPCRAEPTTASSCSPVAIGSSASCPTCE